MSMTYQTDVMLWMVGDQTQNRSREQVKLRSGTNRRESYGEAEPARFALYLYRPQGREECLHEQDCRCDVLLWSTDNSQHHPPVLF